MLNLQKFYHRKTAIVTGASSGIGLEVATLLASSGCHLVLVSRREDKLIELADYLEKRYKVTTWIIALDLAEPNSAQTLIKKVQSLNLPIDILVNNAGVGQFGEFVKSDFEATLKMIQLNIATLSELSHHFGNIMKSQGEGFILNVASLGGLIALPKMSAYTATKAYVLNFSEGLHEELRPYGVNVTALCPGPTSTGFMDHSDMEMASYTDLVFMTAKPVAKTGLLALAKNKPIVVTGRLNQITLFSRKWMPRQWLTRLAGKFM